MQDSIAPIHSPFTCATFAPHVGEIFSLTLPDGSPGEMTLVSAELRKLNQFDGRAAGKSGFVRTDPFSLLFRWNGGEMFGQGLRMFDHPQIGVFQMNIVPVGPGESGWLYEAVFN